MPFRAFDSIARLCFLGALAASAFQLPSNFDEYIQKGDETHGNLIHVVVACHREFDHAMTGIVVHRGDPQECRKWQHEVLCIHQVYSGRISDEKAIQQCKIIDYPIFKRLFSEAPEDTIGFPTQFWESGGWYKIAQNFPVAISPPDAQEIFENKLEFEKYMNQHGHGRYIPKSYYSEAEIVYPCIIKLKPITGTSSSGVLLLHNATDLAEAMKHRSEGESPQLQEAILSNAEITAYFGAFKGRLLNHDLCKVSISGELDIMSNDLRGERTIFPCAAIPGYVEHVRPLYATLARDLGIDGFAFANIKLKGVTGREYFKNQNLWGNLVEMKDSSYVKILEINARIGGGLYGAYWELARFFRSYHLAYYCAKNKIITFDKDLFWEPKQRRLRDSD